MGNETPVSLPRIHHPPDRHPKGKIVPGTIFIGTSGYDYPEWSGLFYPAAIKRKDYLSYYAEHFNAVELNFFYYRIPTKTQIENMIQRSNGKLHFSIKADKQLTHEIEPNKWKDIAAEYRQSIDPLLNAFEGIPRRLPPFPLLLT
jgi:uncharacterized protein YecE (DUF72 family)